MKKHKTEIRVRWNETDCAGVVYFGNYLSYIEAAEEELFRSLGKSEARWKEDYKIRLPRVEVKCQYKSPAYYDDLLEIRTWVELKGKALLFHGEIFRKGEERPLATGYLKCLCVDFRDGKFGSSRPLPQEMVEALRPYLMEGDDFQGVVN